MVDPDEETADIDTENNSWPKRKKLGEFGEAHYMTLAPGDVIYVADTIKPDLHKFIENPIQSKKYSKR